MRHLAPALALAALLAGCGHGRALEPALPAPVVPAVLAKKPNPARRPFHLPTQGLCAGGNTTVQTIGGTIYISGPNGNTTLQQIGGTIYASTPKGNWTIQSIGGTVYISSPPGNTTIQAIGGTVYVTSPSGSSTVQVIGGTQYISGAAQDDFVWLFVTLDPAVSVQVPPMSRLSGYFVCNS